MRRIQIKQPTKKETAVSDRKIDVIPMLRLVLILIATSLILSNHADATDQTTHNVSNNPAVEQVTVYGVRPGPELWKVSNGENKLWVLGTLSLLPKKMTWHSQLVEAVIEDSQVYLLPPEATTDMGFFKKLSLATSIIGIKKSPNKKQLKDIVPEDLYARWLILKIKYIGNDRSIEKTRPIFAADELFNKAIKKFGLAYDTKVKQKVRKLAKKNKLEFIKPVVTITVNKPKSAIKKFKKSEMDDLECFRKTMERLEVDLETMQLRANAWADGDLSKIRELKFPDQNKACGNAFLNSDLAKDTGIKSIRPRLRVAWIDAAIKALNENKSTFAILPMSNLMGDNSYLNDLTSKGYTIKVPK